ncbi:hypothetical protein AAVH_27262 [Aphelenchoides avenae]|nr:hypothetical protein AAVH_27262 [Aphelenchus avenae]
MTDVKEVIFVCIEAVLLAFHLTVITFIITQMMKRNVKFTSAFFVIYTLLSLADIGNYMMTFYMQRLMPYGIIIGQPSPIICNLILFFSAFCSHFQFSSHTTIAMNRYTVILLPTVHNKLWKGIRLFAIIATYAAISIALSCTSLAMGLDSAKNSDGGYDFAVTGNFGAVSANGYLLAGYSVATSAISAALELRTFIAFRSLTKSRQREQRDEFRLLICAMACFVAHFLMTYGYVCMYFAGGQVAIGMMYVMDILCFSGPICLFVTSKSVRVGYLRFIGLKRAAGSAKVSMVLEARSAKKTTVPRESTIQTRVHARRY